MKRTLTFLFVLCALLLLCACGRIQDLKLPAFPGKTENSIPAESVVPTQTEIQEEVPQIPEKTPEEIYAPVIEKYRTAATAKMSAEDLMTNGLNYIAAYCYGDAPLERLGYCIYDLDGDGVPELFIGSRTNDEYQDKIILELYTISEQEPKMIFSSGERERYYLCSSGKIGNENSNSAFDSSFIIYSLANGELAESEAILFDMAADRNNPWFYETAGSKTGIDDAAANAKISEMQNSYVIVNYTPFSQ